MDKMSKTIKKLEKENKELTIKSKKCDLEILKMHEEKHGDVVAKERAARAERARDHVGRRRHSAAAEKLLAAGSPATRRRSSVPGRS